MSPHISLINITDFCRGYFFVCGNYNVAHSLEKNSRACHLQRMHFYISSLDLVWAWPASQCEIGSLEDNMQLSRNDEYV